MATVHIPDEVQTIAEAEAADVGANPSCRNSVQVQNIQGRHGTEIPRSSSLWNVDRLLRCDCPRDYRLVRRPRG
jgi:hypothetical protein